MTRVITRSRIFMTKALSLAVLAAVPAVALLVAGPGVLSALSADSPGEGVPGGTTWGETRSYRARGGDQVGLPPHAAAGTSRPASDSAGEWKNTAELKSGLFLLTPRPPLSAS